MRTMSYSSRAGGACRRGSDEPGPNGPKQAKWPQAKWHAQSAVLGFDLCICKDGKTYPGRIFSCCAASMLASRQMAHAERLKFIDVSDIDYPASRALAAGNTGLHKGLRSIIVGHALASAKIARALEILNAKDCVCFVCRHGMHRSVALADVVAERTGLECCHLDLEDGVLSRRGVWPLKSDGSYVQDARPLVGGSLFTRSEVAIAELRETELSVVLGLGYVLLVGAFEFGPYSEPVKLLLFHHLSSQAEVGQEMVLPACVSECSFGASAIKVLRFRSL